MRIISNASYTANTKPLFKSLEKILNIWDLFEHQFDNFMFEFDHGNLPEVFNSLFVKINDTYAHNTRSACQGKLSVVAKSNTVRHGDAML